ncbi:hypothetical protein E4U11_006338 [Claviceps purpurea]|nr:hypothetical protein E4U11_006338 [Claviceps purpurea]
MSLVLSSIIEGWMRRSIRTTHHQPTGHSSTSFARMQSTYPNRPWKLCSISKTPVEHTLSRDKPLDRKRFVKMDNPLDQTTLTTISLLESRLLRIEHVLHGHAASHPAGQAESAIQRIQNLEKRFSMLISRIRVYGELLKIYKSTPDLFHAPDASEPPSQLSVDAIRSIVLASAPAIPATLSCLTAIQDSPVPDPAESASLIGLTERMKAIEATQLAQAAEMAELRQRSEAVMLAWYERGVLANSQSLADLEGKAQDVERTIRRREVALEGEKRI